MGLSDKLKFAIDPADIFGGRAGEAANAASLQGAEIAAQGERDKLDYLKEVEALPLEIRNKFLPQLADIYSGGEGQQQLIDQAQESPLYNAIMGGQSVGEDAILRNASMTGALRSGNVSADLTDYGSQLSNQALLESYNQQLQGISGLAGIPLNTNNIGNAIAAPSGTMSQGYLAGQQGIQNASQQGKQNALAIGKVILGAFTGGASGAAGAAGGGGGFLSKLSDVRLKENIVQIGRKNGINLYSWDWNDDAEKFGLTGSGEGVMAHEVYETHPEHVIEISGYIAVDYSALGLEAA